MELPQPTTHPGTDPADWPPVDGCTLPTAEQLLRLAEFDALFAASLAAVERPGGAPTRVRLLLTGDAGLRDRVQRLADAETSCCSFFTFVVTPRPGDDGAAVVLDIQVPAPHAEILTALVDRAERARGALA